ncbi:MAG: hypothetical protein AB8G23_18650 [Myxococcota bacterium]
MKSRGAQFLVERPSIHRLISLAALTCAALLSCDSDSAAPRASASPEAFCKTLASLRAGEIDVGSDDPNEFVGHVASLEALMRVAPSPVHKDLAQVRDVFVSTRDAGGWKTLLDFAAMQDPALAGAQGRVAEFAAAECGIQDGSLEWAMDESAVGDSLCPAWPRLGSPLMNNRFPYLIATAAANYSATQFWSVPFIPAPPGFLDVPRGGRVEFEADYPFARYFAYHPNDYETNNLASLVDHTLDPDPGSANPWRREIGDGEGRRYTVTLIFDKAPEPGVAIPPNTAYVGQTPDGRFNPAVFLLLRVYAADQGALPPNSAGVPLPALRIYDKDGELVEAHEECIPYPDGYEAPVDKTRFAAFPVPDHRALFHPGEYNTKDNWGLPVTVLANRDNLYLVLFHSRKHGEVYAVRAKKPRTPSRRDGIPLHAEDVDLRLFTVCDYNFWAGRAESCVVDEEIVADDEGFYTLVVSDEAHRPSNATAAEGMTWMSSGEYLDGQLTYRILLTGDPLVEEMRQAMNGGEVSERAAPFIPEIAQCSKSEFEAGGFEGCLGSWSSRLR